MASSSTLATVFPDAWAHDMPSTLVDLMAADYDTLDERARALRALAVDLVHSFEREPVLTAEAALKLLERHHLPARKGKWTLIALSRDLERVYTKSAHGGMRLLHWTGTKLPSPEKLSASAPLPDGGGYLAIYGGGPDILNDEEARNAFAILAEELKVVDLVLWQVQEAQATFWSLRAGAGQSGTNAYTFPDPDNVRRWWSGNDHDAN